MNELINKLTQDILDKGYFFSLATVDDGGVWVSDIFYVADKDWNIYWLSVRDVRHSKAIEQNPNVAGSVRITKSPEELSEALQITGSATIVPEEKNEEVQKLFLQKRGKEKKVDAERYKGSQAWYKLTPTKIRLSHQKTFGLEKQDAL